MMMHHSRRLFSSVREKPALTIDKVLWFSPLFKVAQVVRERGLKGLLTQMYVVRIGLQYMIFWGPVLWYSSRGLCADRRY